MTHLFRMGTIQILILLMGNFNSIKCSHLYTAVQLVHKQLDFFENTIRLFGSFDADVTAFLAKRGQDSAEAAKINETVLENLGAIQNRLHYLLRKKNSVVRTLVDVMFANQTDIRSDEVSMMKESVQVDMKEIKEVAFQCVFEDGKKLNELMNPSSAGQHVDAEKLDAAKKDYDDDTRKLCEALGIYL